jgi:hypothetical protein
VAAEEDAAEADVDEPAVADAAPQPARSVLI